MESNIYYQLAKTESALDHCKRKLFKKNLTIMAMAGAVYILGATVMRAASRLNNAEKERDAALEEKDKALEELRLATLKSANATSHCEGHVSLS